jgi:hypothetical protein
LIKTRGMMNARQPIIKPHDNCIMILTCLNNH